MNSGTNHPSGTGGRGRRRRRGRRGGQGAPGQQKMNAQQGSQQGSQTQNGPSQNRPPRRQHQSQPQQRRNFGGNGNGSNQQQKRSFRAPVNHKTPDAGIYSAPMDHSYRTHSANGNGNGTHVDNSPVETGGVTRPIFAFVDDLFFMAKIQETARKLNVKVDFVKSDKAVLEAAAESETKPSLIIFDLNNHSIKPLTAIPKLKSKFKKETNIIGFLSHLQGDLKLKAQEAGCDMVVPRSAFSQNLPQLLRRHATSGQEVQAEY